MCETNHHVEHRQNMLLDNIYLVKYSGLIKICLIILIECLGNLSELSKTYWWLKRKLLLLLTSVIRSKLFTRACNLNISCLYNVIMKVASAALVITYIINYISTGITIIEIIRLFSAYPALFCQGTNQGTVFNAAYFCLYRKYIRTLKIRWNYLLTVSDLNKTTIQLHWELRWWVQNKCSLFWLLKRVNEYQYYKVIIWIEKKLFLYKNLRNSLHL